MCQSYIEMPANIQTGTKFPISIFPTRIQRMINEVHECHNYPTNYIAIAIV